jgi:hypothetical protein
MRPEKRSIIEKSVVPSAPGLSSKVRRPWNSGANPSGPGHARVRHDVRDSGSKNAIRAGDMQPKPLALADLAFDAADRGVPSPGSLSHRSGGFRYSARSPEC